MKAIKLISTKHIFLITILQILIFHAQTLEEFNKQYEDYYIPRLYRVTPNHEWGLVIGESDSLGHFADLINFKIKKAERISKGIKYSFLGNSQLLYHNANQKMVFKNLKTGYEKYVDSVAICEVRHKEEVILSINDKRDRIRVFNFNGDLIWQKNGLYYLNFDLNRSKLFFAINGKFGSYDYNSKSEVVAPSIEKMVWISDFDDTLVGLLNRDKSKKFLIYNPKISKLSFFDLYTPLNFEISNKSLKQMEIRKDQFLIVPLQVNDNSKRELAEIYYTNTNSEARYNNRMLGVFDIKNNLWKWLPDYKNPYKVQRFVNDEGDFIQYNPYTDIVDSLNNSKTKIELFRNFGDEKHELKNPYYQDNNFYYDEVTNNFLFFENLSWWSENLNNHVVSRISLDKNIIQARSNFNYLDDSPAGDLYPTTKKGIFIVLTQGNMYYWDIVNNKTTAITHGDEGLFEYKMLPLPLLWNFGTSLWNTQRKHNVDISKPFLVQVNNKNTYENGIEKIDGLKSKTIAYEYENIQNIFEGSDVIYTTSSFNKPLEINKVERGIKYNIYSSTGRFSKSRPSIKREHIHYNANGKILNAFLYYPKDFDLKTKYPLVVKVYEKETENYKKDIIPNLNDGTGINIMHYVMNGYFVLIPDLDNAVNDGQKALVNSMNAVLEKVVMNPIIDRDKIGVIGHSFGGYTSGLMIGKTKWFKTAVLGAPITDVVRNSFTLNHLHNSFKPDFYRVERQQNRMNTHVFENWDGYLKASPIYYIPQVHQPILIWGGDNDTNIPPDQPQSYFLGLKRLQKKGVYINYPKENHGFSSKENIEDINYKIWQWFEYTLNGSSPAEWIKPIEQ